MHQYQYFQHEPVLLLHHWVTCVHLEICIVGFWMSCGLGSAKKQHSLELIVITAMMLTALALSTFSTTVIMFFFMKLDF